MTVPAAFKLFCLIWPAIILVLNGVTGQHDACLDGETSSQICAHRSRRAASVQLLTREDVSAFFDGAVPVQLQQRDIAGAVVAVVYKGRVLYAGGYGLADVVSRRPVTTNGTLFRCGSISKLFTWTAVMQLVEQGLIDLDRDVNDYIDFRVALGANGKAVTMRHLMTHTAGWEESVKDLMVANASDLYPLDQYLKERLPRQIYPAGTIPAYSNYGATLAGYIVSRVSNLTFDDYIEKNILRPLGMTRSTFRQPLPADLQPLMSSGYAQSSQEAKPFELVQTSPAGAMSLSAEDLTHFMLAHLQAGLYNGVRLLRPETVELMHSRAFALHDSMNGMALGFYEESRNGLRIIGHGGDLQWFHSDMHLVPEVGLGFFVSYNSVGNKPEYTFLNREQLWEAFLDRYFPYTPPTGSTVMSQAEREALNSALGPYWMSRRAQTTVIALGNMVFESKLKLVTDDSDSILLGDFLLGSDFAGNDKHFRRIAPLLFRDEQGQSRVALINNTASGGWTIVVDVPFMVLQQVPSVFKTRTLNLAVLLPSLTALLLSLLIWPIDALLRRCYRSPQHYLQLPPPSPSRAYSIVWWLMRLVALVDLALMGALAAWYVASSGNLAWFSRRFDGWLWAGLVAALLSAVAGVATGLVLAVVSWRERRSVGWVVCVGNSVLALATLGYAFFLANWNLIGFNVNY